MTGSVQPKGGRWHTVINIYDENGIRRPKWEPTELEATCTKKSDNKRKTTNQKLAEKILYERIAKLEQQASNGMEDILFSDFMREWLEVISVKENTRYQYGLIVNNSIAPFFDKHKVTLQSLEAIHIQKYYNQKRKDGASGNTVKHHHANIHKALNYAKKQGRITTNPADRVELPKVECYRGNFYTSDQLCKILNLVEGTNIETAVLLAAVYGLRRSEAIGLR